MVRFAFLILFLTAGIWFVGFYPMGDKPLAAHVREVYKSPLVQKKMDALEKGVDKTVEQVQRETKKLVGKNDAAEWESAKSKSSRPALARAPMAAASRESGRESLKPLTFKQPDKPAPMSRVQPSKPQAVVDIRPSAGVSKQPAQDVLTDQDRQGLDTLLANKLKR